MNDVDREAFESDATSYGYVLTRAECDYCDYEDNDTQHRWYGWQAACEYKGKQLAAKDAVIEKLREALQNIYDRGPADDMDGNYLYAEEVLASTTNDDTALKRHDVEVRKAVLLKAAEWMNTNTGQAVAVVQLRRMAEEDSETKMKPRYKYKK